VRLETTSASPEASIASRQIGDYLAAIASPSPTPGGGSVAGVVSAMAAGLLEMVCQLTIPKSPSPAEPEKLESLSQHLAKFRADLLAMAAADERAYGAYRDAHRLPKSTEEEKAWRSTELEHALVGAASIPAQLSQACLDLLTEAVEVARIGTSHALSDIRCAALLAHAAGSSALDNVEVNANLMKDVSKRDSLLAEASALRAQLNQALEQLQAALDART
jgi:formiminotetrahydrofolate cyclodeaminase